MMTSIVLLQGRLLLGKQSQLPTWRQDLYPRFAVETVKQRMSCLAYLVTARQVLPACGVAPNVTR